MVLGPVGPEGVEVKKLSAAAALVVAALVVAFVIWFGGSKNPETPVGYGDVQCGAGDTAGR